MQIKVEDILKALLSQNDLLCTGAKGQQDETSNGQAGKVTKGGKGKRVKVLVTVFKCDGTVSNKTKGERMKKIF